MSSSTNGHHSTQSGDLDNFYPGMNIGNSYFPGVNYSTSESNFLPLGADSRGFMPPGNNSVSSLTGGLSRINTGIDATHNAGSGMWDPRTSSTASAAASVLGFPGPTHGQHVLPHPHNHHTSRMSTCSTSPDPQSPESLGYTHTPISAGVSSSSEVASSSTPAWPITSSATSTALPHSMSGAPGSHPLFSFTGSPQLVGSSPLSNSAHLTQGGPLGAHGLGPILPPSAAARSAEKRKRSAQLRTASRAKKSKTPTKRDDESNEEARAREMHNHVEQQYRHRLNDQFELLLEALPKQAIYGVRQGSEDGDGESAGPEKRISKAQVLEIAREYIMGLQEENDSLRRVMEENGARTAWN